MTPRPRWIVPSLLAIGLAVASSPAQAAEIRDDARMFSPEAVTKVQDELSRLERETGIPVLIETIEAIPDLAADASRDAKLRAINQLATKRAGETRAEGIYLLLSKNDRVISNVLTRERYAKVLTREKRLKIRDSFIEPFKAGDFDGGLARAAREIAAALPVGPPAAQRAPAERRPGEAAPVGGQRPEARPQFGVGSLVAIALGILAVLVVVRLLGGLFGGNRAGGYPQQMGMGGMGRPGMGSPGYDPGYGGRGGGFFSGLLGGIGGAMAGNWLYDQFSGRHHSSGGHMGASSHGQDFGASGPQAPGGDSIIGADDGGGMGASWDDGGGGGGDWGGGDWGGGDDGGSW